MIFHGNVIGTIVGKIILSFHEKKRNLRSPLRGHAQYSAAAQEAPPQDLRWGFHRLLLSTLPCDRNRLALKEIDHQALARALEPPVPAVDHGVLGAKVRHEVRRIEAHGHVGGGHQL